MIACALVVPGGPMGRTGGTLYGLYLQAALAQLGSTVQLVPLTDRWPWPDDPERHLHTLRRLPAGLPLLIDGLLWPGLSPAASPLLARNPCTVIVHSPLFRETGLSPTERAHAREAEGAALARAHTVVGTGQPTLRDLADHFHRPAHCIEPGVHPRPRVEAADPTALACLATVTPRKDHPFLLEALAQEPLQGVRLACAGSLARTPLHAEHCRSLAGRLGLSTRVSWRGELGPEPLRRLLERTGLVVQTARYEAYGMAIAEAISAGIPVVSRPAGALEGPCGDAAVVVDTDDPRKLADAIATLDHTGLVAAARRVAPRLPTWLDVARRFRDLLGLGLV